MLDEMKEAGRSEHSGTVVKKKSSSGCLIIKKKVADSVGGSRGFSVPSSRKSCNSSKGKKRPRFVGSDSESSGESSETIRRKVDKFRNCSVVKKGVYLENREKRVSNGLDVFEFDEYDGFDERRIRKDVDDGRYRLNVYSQSGDGMEPGSSGSRMIVDRRRDFHYDNRSTMLGTKRGRPSYGATGRLEMEEDESHLPLSVLSEKYRMSSNEPIRLQGKNGVLKVMVNKDKQMGVSRRSYDRTEAGDGWSNKNKSVMKPSLYSNFDPWKPSASKSKEKRELKLRKPMLAKCSKETYGSDTPMHFKSFSRGRGVKNEGAVNVPTGNVNRVKGKESKVKRGSGTEKQLLREKIKSMLLAAGWTIDYRPRKNRDYLDAVYINPAGTAYWSIIKAYEALQKEEEDDSKAGRHFSPLPDEIIGKLTRQTRKKIEREMKKRKNESNGRNGKSARVKDVAEDSDSDQQEEKLTSYMKHSHKLKKGRPEEANEDDGGDSSDNSYMGTPMYDRAAKTMVGSDAQTQHGRKNRKIGKRTLLVRSSNKGLNSETDGFVPCSGKLTLLSWLIDSGTVPMSEHVQYMNYRKSRIMQKGWITKDGIHCGCCSKILPVSKFELHAGSKLRQPFPNIFLQSGKSLMHCQIDAWNKQGETERKGFYTVDGDGDDPNDDTCGLCGDGGDLICCDGCPSTFHQSCLDIQMLPQGDWHCPNCSCKFCEIAGGICNEDGVKTETSLLMCCLCERKYHESCKKEMDVKPIDSYHLNLSFCGRECQKVLWLFHMKRYSTHNGAGALYSRIWNYQLYSHLQKLLGAKHELDSGFSWSLIHRCDTSDASSVELPQRVECNSMLAVAMSVMDECFLPVADRKSGINIIRNVVFNCGSNLSRLNYNGFFTAVLERGDEVISAASIRIHGTQLAEMPFIGTRHIYRRQGMCRRLLSAIESALSSIQVEKLIIPAIAEHMHTWSDVFGFHPLEESHKQELRSMNMLVFPGTDMLQKPLVKQGMNTIQAQGNKGLPEKPESESSDPKEFVDKNATAEVDSRESSDDGCSVKASKETLAISSAKDVPNKSELVSDSSNELALNASDDASRVNGKFSIETAGTLSSDNPQLELVGSVEKITVQEGNEIPFKTTAIPSSDIVSSEPQFQLLGKESVSVSISDNNVEEIAAQNGGRTHVLDPVASDIPVQVSGKESVSDSVSDPNVEEIAARIGDGTRVLDPSRDSVASDIPVQLSGKESVSVSVSDPNVEEIAAQSGVGTHVLDTSRDSVASDIPFQLSGKESVSASVSDPNVEEIAPQNGGGTHVLDTSRDSVASDIPFQLSGKESVPDSDPNAEEIAAQNDDQSHRDSVASDIPLQLSGMESVSSISDSMVVEIVVQNGSEAAMDVVSLKAPNVPSDRPREGELRSSGPESLSVDTQTDVTLEKPSTDIKSHSDLPGTD